MSSGPTITGVEMTTYEFLTDDMGTDRHGFNLVYSPGDKLKQVGAIIQIHTDAGISGEFPIHAPPARTQVAMCAGYLIGKDVTAREQIYNETKRALRQFDMTGVGVIDIILWDIAGKMYNEPLYRLLGGTRRPLAAYASTVHGDENGICTIPMEIADKVAAAAHKILEGEEATRLSYLEPGFNLDDYAKSRGLTRKDPSRGF